MSERHYQPDLMGYLYGEISEEERQKVEAWLAKHPEEQAELEQLRETRSWLANAPPAPPQTSPLFVEEATTRRRLPKLTWMNAAAAVLLLLLTTIGTQVDFTGNGMQITFGTTKSEAPSDGWREELLQTLAEKDRAAEQRLDSLQQAMQKQLLQQQSQLLDNWQHRLAAHDAQQRKKLKQFASDYYQKEVPYLIANVQEIQLQQREELQIILNDMWNDWLEVRSADWQIIQANMAGFQENLKRNQNQTQVLEDILVQAYK
jgi:hypothetical protein